MHPNAELIQTFYTSFKARDAMGMNACYHPAITFSDPVFGTLQGSQVTAMWRMLCERGKDLEIAFDSIQADDEAGSARWQARYTFSKSGRRVHNRIAASFNFQDGKIIRHSDSFDLWKWSAMALGPLGTFLGWTPFVRYAIRREAQRGLENHIQKQAT